MANGESSEANHRPKKENFYEHFGRGHPHESHEGGSEEEQVKK